MFKYQVSADSSSDMNLEYIQNSDLFCIPMNYEIDGVECQETFLDKDKFVFFHKMREGSIARSTQVTPQMYLDHWEAMYEKSKLPIIHVALSSGLSGTYANGETARAQFLEKHPDAIIHVQDSFSATQGEGLQINKLIQMRDEGKSFEEAVEWVKYAAPRTHAIVTVDDLVYLKRGGRVSPTAAWVGTLMSIKPMIKINTEGKLEVFEKAKGRKRALQRMVDVLAEVIENPQDQLIHLTHADCDEDANILSEMIMEQIKPKGIFKVLMGNIIGAHAGPGTLATFCVGKLR